MEKLHLSYTNKVKKNIEIPAKSRAPLSCTHPNKVSLALKEKRVQCKKYETQIARMEKEIKSGVELGDEL